MNDVRPRISRGLESIWHSHLLLLFSSLPHLNWQQHGKNVDGFTPNETHVLLFVCVLVSVHRRKLVWRRLEQPTAGAGDRGALHAAAAAARHPARGVVGSWSS